MACFADSGALVPPKLMQLVYPVHFLHRFLVFTSEVFLLSFVMYL